MSEIISGRVLPDVHFAHIFLSGTTIACARDMGAHHMLQNNFDVLIQWDSDLKPALGHFVQLLEHDVPFVAGGYCKHEMEALWNFHPKEGAEITDGKLWEMNQIALGFSATKREVFETLLKLHPERHYANKELGSDKMELHQFFPMEIQGQNTAQAKLERLKLLLSGPVAPNIEDVWEIVMAGDYSHNLMVGEDYAFCKSLREAGIPMYLDSRIIVPHTSQIDLPVSEETVIRLLAEDWRRARFQAIKEAHLKTKQA